MHEFLEEAAGQRAHRDDSHAARLRLADDAGRLVEVAGLLVEQVVAALQDVE